MHKKRWAQSSNCARGIKEPLPSSFRLLTWNIDFASKAPKRRLAAALEYIRRDVFECKTPSERPNPCCILLQEVSVQAFTLILANEWVQGSFLVVPSSTEKWPHGAHYGNVTLISRMLPVCGAFTIDFSNSNMTRNGLFVDLKLAVPAPPHAPRLSDGIVQMRIANTHLESLPQGARARPEQLGIIAESLQEYDLHGGVVGGDMNAIGPSDMRIAEQVGLTDAWQGSEEEEEGITWGHQPPSQYPPRRLDKVLWVARGGVEVEEPVRVGVGAKCGTGEWVSDHYGLVTNVHVPARYSLFRHRILRRRGRRTGGARRCDYSAGYDQPTMKTAFASVALFVSGALAQFMINTPANVVECEPLQLNWQGGTRDILPGATPNGIAIESFPQTNSTSYTWLVNIASGTSIGLTVRDNTGVAAQSAAVTVNPGSMSFPYLIGHKICLVLWVLMLCAASPGPTVSDSGSSTAPATVTGGSSTAGTGTATGASSSPTSTSTSKSGASANIAQFGAAGIIGVAVAALFL
ncbi:Endonuclease/exonuclease/phosphatase [Boletus edulis]|nr:Endonuclease/exonuclease/phosphatase [Boletus edulis]